MTGSELAVTCGGALTLLMGGFHVTFPKRFVWDADFGKIAPVNARVLYTIHLALLLLFILLGSLSVWFRGELATGRGLGGGLTLAMAAFWAWRATWQWLYFRPPSGPGGASRRRLHYAVAAHFTLTSLAYLAPFAL